MKNQKGFTLIELIVVIVILGILAATALPKFTSMKSEAEAAALMGVAGAVNSANAVNRAVKLVNPASGVTIGNCDVAGSLLDGGLPAGFTAGPASAITAGNTSNTCTITGPYNGATSAVFVTITGA